MIEAGAYAPGSWEEMFATPYSPEADVVVDRLRHEDVSIVGCLTFKSCRNLLDRAVAGQRDEGDALAFVARTDGRPVGLVLAEKIRGGDEVAAGTRKILRLRSIFTNLLWQHKGIGRWLLDTLTGGSRDAGYHAIHTEYNPKLESIQPFERLLASSGWSNPKPFMEELFALVAAKSSVATVGL
ncbi:GNAT family N-acetyltransferase [Chlorobium sp. N1]|uniref:GNAT family N-acetyltransferase n=1 Tax=Chlorobium sp. N1 TaxID=2491138 RepID=UPI00103F82DC|nr:GNAT family N-acetyltransferase [Chlorobium sp. N1]TCD47036.1 N-acetyltransferase [Chlorobium sp. N1]